MDNTEAFKTKRGREPKPKYNTWQNTVYVLRSAWKHDKHAIFVIIAEILLTPSISAVSMFLPMTVVALITQNAAGTVLLAAILSFTAAITVLQTAKSYFDNTSQPRRIGLRLWVCIDILNKAITTDFANLEDKKFTDAKQKAHDATSNNRSATEHIYYTFESLGANLIGFALYIALLIQINPLILALTAATTIAGFIVRRWANQWRFVHDDENAQYHKRTWYVANLGENKQLAKDIRLFAMKNWLNAPKN